MTKIKPFRAFTYNTGNIDLTRVVCPPYDVISKARQDYYHELSPHNFIRILLGKDIPGEDKYSRARNYFKDWIKEKIIVQEQSPAIYFYSQQYNLKGEKKTRLGFIALLGLPEEGVSVFGHEHTRLEPKEDRLKLLKSVKANLSPIFVVFQDKKRIIPYLYQRYIKDTKPLLEAVDDEKTLHRLWRLDDPLLIAAIQKKASLEDVFIADGHHRFEVACAYRNEMKNRLGKITGDEDFNYVLAYFTNLDPRGLAILAIHRLIKLGPGFNWEGFMPRLQEYFDVEEVRDVKKFFFLMEKGGRSEHLLGMYKNKKYWFLRLKNIKILDIEMPDKAKVYRALDVSILNSLVLNKILGLAFDDKERISFSPYPEELIVKVDKDQSLVAFFLNPVRVEQVMSVALAGQKMPPKSTYFYPKVLSGLVINKLNDDKS